MQLESAERPRLVLRGKLALRDDFTEAEMERIWDAISARDHRRMLYREVSRWSWYIAAVVGVAFMARLIFH